MLFRSEQNLPLGVSFSGNTGTIGVYSSTAESITLWGPVTGARYEVTPAKPETLVDPRDGLGMLKSGLFRLQGFTRAHMT